MNPNMDEELRKELIKAAVIAVAPVLAAALVSATKRLLAPVIDKHWPIKKEDVNGG